MGDTGSGPQSAARLAELLGDAVPRPEDLDPSAARLADAVRELIAAVVTTDVSSHERDSASRQVVALAEVLRSSRREPHIALARHDSGWVENLTQAGSGRWNPQAPHVEWGRLTVPRPGSPPAPIEIRATCTLTAAHAGPPGRVHGGVLVTLLDEALGNAAVAAGAGGLTAGINVRFRRATPFDRPLLLRARYVRSDGRKHVATGEIVVDGEVTVEAEGIFVAAPRD